MNKLTRNFMIALSFLLVTALSSSNAVAQRGGGGASPMEFSATYGSMWGGNIETHLGTLRTATGPSIGLALDVSIKPGLTLELSYTRQEGALDLDSLGATRKLTNMSVGYWQIGAIRVLRAGKVQPFVTTSLGATYYSPEESTVLLEDETYEISTSTKFSFVIGAGFKTYFGQNEKIGLRASIKTFPTFYSTEGGVWFGTGGASVGFSGNAVWQWEAAAGLTVKFGA